MSDLRKDPVSGRWVIISKERGNRPNPFRQYSSKIPAESQADCPLCPGKEQSTPREIVSVRNGSSWSVRTVPNLYPALRIEGTLDMRPEGLYDMMQGIGAHEVIVESPQHDLDIHQFSQTQTADVIRMYRDRMVDLMRDGRFRYILVFKNHGEQSGATLAHPHSQVIALPIVPIQIERELSGSKEYQQYRGRCIYCDILNQEVQDGRRLVVQNGEFVAYAPFASRFPFEIQIIPLTHAPFFWTLNDNQIERFAEILRDVLRRYNLALRNPAYNYVIHTAPHGSASHESYHWQMQVMPRMTTLAGFEWGTGFYINPMPPEEAAQYLRELEQVMDVPSGHLHAS